ncbi:hypothetical protein [Staphylococcus hyicus]|uniref:Uncharacterized protein n=1 Tax=Staphylococcus hyicus TaxID=1284 RepID=A0ACD5FKR4_STAHY|nr:hypothetical protein [Staphylococcus hyicus]MDP4464467.1 hypothetical protein [Staphylococcus hyicus]
MSHHFKVFFATYLIINILLKSLGNFCVCLNHTIEFVIASKNARCNGIPNVI